MHPIAADFNGDGRSGGRAFRPPENFPSARRDWRRGPTLRISHTGGLIGLAADPGRR
jgi:hypothetical protein